MESFSNIIVNFHWEKVSPGLSWRLIPLQLSKTTPLLGWPSWAGTGQSWHPIAHPATHPQDIIAQSCLNCMQHQTCMVVWWGSVVRTALQWGDPGWSILRLSLRKQIVKRYLPLSPIVCFYCEGHAHYLDSSHHLIRWSYFISGGSV